MTNDKSLLGTARTSNTGVKRLLPFRSRKVQRSKTPPPPVEHVISRNDTNDSSNLSSLTDRDGALKLIQLQQKPAITTVEAKPVSKENSVKESKSSKNSADFSYSKVAQPNSKELENHPIFDKQATLPQPPAQVPHKPRTTTVNNAQPMAKRRLALDNGFSVAAAQTSLFTLDTVQVQKSPSKRIQTPLDKVESKNSISESTIESNSITDEKSKKPTFEKVRALLSRVNPARGKPELTIKTPSGASESAEEVMTPRANNRAHSIAEEEEEREDPGAKSPTNLYSPPARSNGRRQSEEPRDAPTSPQRHRRPVDAPNDVQVESFNGTAVLPTPAHGHERRLSKHADPPSKTNTVDEDIAACEDEVQALQEELLKSLSCESPKNMFDDWQDENNAAALQTKNDVNKTRRQSGGDARNSMRVRVQKHLKVKTTNPFDESSTESTNILNSLPQKEKTSALKEHQRPLQETADSNTVLKKKAESMAMKHKGRKKDSINKETRAIQQDFEGENGKKDETGSKTKAKSYNYPDEIAFAPDPNISDLEQQSFRELMNTHVLQQKESEDVDRYAPLMRTSKQSIGEHTMSKEWSIEQADSEETGAVEVLLKSCGFPGVCAPTQRSAIPAELPKNKVQVYQSSVPTMSEHTVEETYGETTFPDQPTFPDKTPRVSNTKPNVFVGPQDPIGIQPLLSYVDLELDPSGIQAGNDDTFSEQDYTEADELTLDRSVSEDIFVDKYLAFDEAIPLEARILQFGQALLGLSPTSTKIVDAKMQDLSPSSREVLHKSVEIAQIGHRKSATSSRDSPSNSVVQQSVRTAQSSPPVDVLQKSAVIAQSNPSTEQRDDLNSLYKEFTSKFIAEGTKEHAMIDLTMVDDIGDDEDEAVWLFDVSPKSGVEKSSDQYKSNVDSILEFAARKLGNNAHLVKGNEKKVSALESILNFTSTLVKFDDAVDSTSRQQSVAQHSRSIPAVVNDSVPVVHGVEVRKKSEAARRIKSLEDKHASSKPSNVSNRIPLVHGVDFKREPSSNRDALPVNHVVNVNEESEADRVHASPREVQQLIESSSRKETRVIDKGDFFDRVCEGTEAFICGHEEYEVIHIPAERGTALENNSVQEIIQLDDISAFEGSELPQNAKSTLDQTVETSKAVALPNDLSCEVPLISSVASAGKISVADETHHNTTKDDDGIRDIDETDEWALFVSNLNDEVAHDQFEARRSLSATNKSFEGQKFDLRDGEVAKNEQHSSVEVDSMGSKRKSPEDSYIKKLSCSEDDILLSENESQGKTTPENNLCSKEEVSVSIEENKDGRLHSQQNSPRRAPTPEMLPICKPPRAPKEERHIQAKRVGPSPEIPSKTILIPEKEDDLVLLTNTTEESVNQNDKEGIANDDVVSETSRSLHGKRNTEIDDKATVNSETVQNCQNSSFCFIPWGQGRELDDERTTSTNHTEEASYTRPTISSTAKARRKSDAGSGSSKGSRNRRSRSLSVTRRNRISTSPISNRSAFGEAMPVYNNGNIVEKPSADDSEMAKSIPREIEVRDEPKDLQKENQLQNSLTVATQISSPSSPSRQEASIVLSTPKESTNDTPKPIQPRSLNKSLLLARYGSQGGDEPISGPPTVRSFTSRSHRSSNSHHDEDFIISPTSRTSIVRSDDGASLILALTRSELEGPIAIESESADSNSPLASPHAGVEGCGNVISDSAIHTRGDERLSRVEEARASVVSPKNGSYASSSNMAITGSTPKKEFSRSPRVQGVLERLRARRRSQNDDALIIVDDLTTKSDLTEHLDAEDLFSKYDSIAKEMNISDDERMNRIQQRQQSDVNEAKASYKGDPPSPNRRESKFFTTKTPNRRSFGMLTPPKQERSSSNKALRTNQSFDTEYSQTPSQKARDLRKQLEAALQTSAAIRTSQERLGAELSTFKTKIQQQRNSPRNHHAQQSASFSLASSATLGIATMEQTTDASTTEKSATQAPSTVYSVETSVLAKKNNCCAPVQRGNFVYPDHSIWSGGSSASEDNSLFIEDNESGEDKVRTQHLDSIIHGLRSAEKRKQKS